MQPTMQLDLVRNAIRRSLRLGPAAPREPQPWLLFSAAVGLVVASLIAIYGIVMARGQRDALDDAEALTRSVASALADQLTRATQTVELVLADLADRRTGGFAEMAASRLPEIAQIRAVLATDAIGRVTQSSVESLKDQLIGEREWFRVLRFGGQTLRLGAPEGGRFLGPGTRPISETRLWSIPMARAIRTPRGEFDGAAVALLNPDYFVAIARRYADAFGVTVRLHSFGGLLLARSDGSAQGIGVLNTSAWPFRDFLPRRENGSFRGVDQDGVESVASFAVTLQGSFVVEVARSRDDAFEPLRRLGWLLAGGVGAHLAVVPGVDEDGFAAAFERGGGHLRLAGGHEERTDALGVVADDGLASVIGEVTGAVGIATEAGGADHAGDVDFAVCVLDEVRDEAGVTTGADCFITCRQIAHAHTFFEGVDEHGGC